MGKSLTPIEQARERVESVHAELVRLLGLDSLGVDVRIAFTSDLNDDQEVIADTKSNWHYREATITWYLSAVARLDDERLEMVAVHEILHALLSPMESKVPAKHAELNEFAVETVARAITHLIRELRD